MPSLTPQELDVAAVCAEYGPSQATAADHHNDLCQWVLSWWLRRNGFLIEIGPDGPQGKCVLSVKCENVLGEETLAHAYEGTEQECLRAAESLRSLSA